MSDTRKDGGPAFGTPYDQMSVRDYFAAVALEGIIACPTAHTIKDTGALVDTPEQVSEAAYRYADAMLAQREKP